MGSDAVAASVADRGELLATLDEVGPPEVWITHGREEALAHAAGQRGIRARRRSSSVRGSPSAPAGPVAT